VAVSAPPVRVRWRPERRYSARLVSRVTSSKGAAGVAAKGVAGVVAVAAGPSSDVVVGVTIGIYAPGAILDPGAGSDVFGCLGAVLGDL
jgi:hypothetical protein